MSARSTRIRRPSGMRGRIVAAIAAAAIFLPGWMAAGPLMMPGAAATDAGSGSGSVAAASPSGGPIPASLPLADDSALGNGITLDRAADGTIYASAWTFGGGRWIVALDATGHARPGWPVQVTPGSRPVLAADGTAFVLACDAAGCQLHALTTAGTERHGWPATLAGTTSCDPPLPGTRDVEVVCSRGASGIRVFRFALSGPLQRGWPVDVPGQAAASRRVGTVLFLVAAEAGGTRLVAIGADASLHRGMLVGTVGDAGGGRGYAIGEDGTAYAWGHRIRGLTASGFSIHVSSALIAFDRGGVKPGWPVITRTPMSDPAIANGVVYVTLGTPTTRASLVALDRAGHTRPGWPVLLPVPAITGQEGEGGAPWRTIAAPSVAPDGTIVVTSISGGTTVAVVSPAGSMRGGWPYRTAFPLASACIDATGCGDPRIPPLLAAGGVVDVPVRVGSGSAARDRIVRLGATGRVSPGWPFIVAPATTHVTALGEGPSGMLLVATQSISSAPAVALTGLTAAGRVAFRTTLIVPVPPSSTVGIADSGSTRTMQVGDRFVLALTAGFDWTVSVADPTVLGRVQNITVPNGAQGVYEALRPGTTALTATGDPPCRHAVPPCAAPTIFFQLHVVVR